MAQKSISGNETLAKQIKQRRIELGLTIEEAASRASVGTKTWCRYEAGKPIRQDKCKGICKALNWHTLAGLTKEEDEALSIQEFKKHESWSPFLENKFGINAAMAFAAGSDILLDHIEEDMAELASMPSGSHIGQLNISWLSDILPEQFLTFYNYDFLYRLKCTLCNLRIDAKDGVSMLAHTVTEELLLYLCNEEATALIELYDNIDELEKNVSTEKWVFDLFGDMDIITFLYSDVYLDSEHPYHFYHWNEQQFYIDSVKANT